MNFSEQESVKAFVSAAREFCDWSENSIDDQDADFRAAITLLPRLYSCAIVLPEAHGDESEVNDLPDAQLRMVQQRFRKLPFDFYSQCYDPFPSVQEKPTQGSLDDDLGDTYNDVKRGLLHFDAGFPDQAVWYWQFHFRFHWGRHVIDALRAVHCYADQNFLWPHTYLKDDE